MASRRPASDGCGMPRPRDEVRRREVLDALIAAVADGGIGDRSLRDIAAAAGKAANQ